jgi:hypothetical protein
VSARIWLGRTKADDYSVYPTHLEESGVAAFKGMAGTEA